MLFVGLAGIAGIAGGAQSARAGWIDFNVAPVNSTVGSSESKLMFTNFSAGASFLKSFQLGVNLAVISGTVGSETWSGYDFGPKLATAIGKSGDWNLGISYHLLAQSKTGSGLQVEFGFVPVLWKKLHGGFKLVYSKSSTTDPAVTVTERSGIFPVASFSYQF